MCIKTLAEEAPSRVPNIEISGGDAAKTVKLDPVETIALERAARAHAATNPLIAVPEPEPVDPQFVELFIEEAKEEIASIQSSFPQWDQNPMDLESLASDAPQLPHLEGQRPHGRRPRDRGVRLVDRESAESNHRQDPDAHAWNDGAAAQRRGRPAAVGGAVGDAGATIPCRSKR